jgi:hypothetical protein
MRVGLWTAGFLLTSAIVSNAATVNISPPPQSQTQLPLPPLPPMPVQATAPDAAKTVAPATAKAPAPAPKIVRAPAPAPAMAKAPAPAPKIVKVPTPAPAIAKAPAPAPKMVKAPAPAAVIAKAPAPVPKIAKAPTPTPAPVTAKAPVLAKAQTKAQTKVCPCDCPNDHPVRQNAQVRPSPRRVFRRYADSGYYRYSSAAPVMRHEWHGQWRAAPNDAYIPGPMASPAYGYYQEGVQVDDRGWTGGVGAAPDGGGGGGFVDGYGQVHFATGGSVENGPTYNGYNQSFQYNPSQAGPFQPRSMGGYAPPSTSSR